MNAGDSVYYKMSDGEVNYHIIGVILSQKFSLIAGLKQFGKPEEKSNVKELTKICDITTFIPLDPNNLTR